METIEDIIKSMSDEELEEIKQKVEELETYLQKFSKR